MQIFTTCPPPAPAPWYVAGAPLFSALATVIIGAIAASIAYRQWLTAQEKLRLDLYDRRWAVYEQCIALTKSLEGTFLEQIFKAAPFYDQLSAASFLFDDEIKEFMSGLGSRMDDRRKELAERVPPVGASEEEIALAYSLGQSRWRREEEQRIEAAFRPYLRFTNLQRPAASAGLAATLRNAVQRPKRLLTLIRRSMT